MINIIMNITIEPNNVLFSVFLISLFPESFHEIMHLSMLAIMAAAPIAAHVWTAPTNKTARIPKNDIAKSKRKCRKLLDGRCWINNSVYLHQNLSINKNDVT